MESPQATSSKSSSLAWLVLALTAAWCVFWFVHALGYWEDDAWIHLEFARSVATGHGFSFNGHVVYGDTSPMWVWLLVFFHSLIPVWMTAGKTLSAVATVFALSGAFAFSRSLVRDALAPAAANLFAATMVLILVTNPYFGYWAYSGMEALTAAGLVCWGGVVAGPRVLSTPHFLLGCAIAGIAPLLRPEMSFFTVLFGLILLLRWTKMQGTLARRIPVLLAGFLLASAPAIAWGRYALHTFGMIVPNTNAAKRAPPQDNILLKLVKIYTFGFPVIAIGLVVLAVWAVWYFRKGRQQGTRSLAADLTAPAWMLFVWTAINCVFYVLNHTYVQTRYIFVTAPVLTIVLLALAARRSPKLYKALVIFAVVFGVSISSLATWHLITNKIEVDHVYALAADFVRTLPPDAPVANYSIGEAAFLSEHPIIDTGGITRPGMIPYLFDKDESKGIQWAIREGAKYMVIDHQPVPGSVLVWSHYGPTTGWFLNPRRYREGGQFQIWTLPQQ